jgi:hypothetical protein
MTISVNGSTLTFSDATTMTTAAVTGSGNYVATTYASPATWTASKANLKAVKVTVVGAGGNGGNATGSTGKTPTTASGGGGGGGGWAITFMPSTLSTTTQPLTVGASPGGTSSFGSLVTCTGGANAPSVVSVAGSGGAGGATTLDVSFVPGGGTAEFNNPAPGGRGFVPSPAYYFSGEGGSTLFGTGGLPVTTSSAGSTGQDGTGGSGACSINATAQTGGLGKSGIIIVEEFY